MNGTFAWLAFTLLSCSSAGAARKAHAALDCPEASIEVTELTDNRYRTVGCDKNRIYRCEAGECVRDGRFADKARIRGSRELGCTEGQLELRWVQDEEYRVEGCGKGITYNCSDSGCAPLIR